MHPVSRKSGRPWPTPRAPARFLVLALFAVTSVGCNVFAPSPPACTTDDFGAPSTGHVAAGSPLDAARVEAIVNDYLAASGGPSIAAGIVHGDELVFSTAVGMADLAAQRPATVDTLYEIGSVTKTFTATLLAQLVDDGRVELDDPVTPFLPHHPDISVNPNVGDTITFRQLATHTSGLDRDAPNLALVYLGDHDFDADDLLFAASTSSLLFDPGAGRSYSNLGFALLGLALESCAGEPYDTMLRARILDPLGMGQTFLAIRPGDFADVAPGYVNLVVPWPFPQFPSGVLSPAGGLVSNVPDMARYLSANLRAVAAPDADRLGHAMRAALTLRAGPDCEISQALGWQTRDDSDFDGVLWHGGSLNGHAAFVAIEPRANVGVVVLTNSWTRPIDLGYDLLQVAIDAFGTAPQTARVIRFE